MAVEVDAEIEVTVASVIGNGIGVDEFAAPGVATETVVVVETDAIFAAGTTAISRAGLF
jgi:hypothetical protein